MPMNPRRARFAAGLLAALATGPAAAATGDALGLERADPSAFEGDVTTERGALLGDYLSGLVASRLGDYGRAATFFNRVVEDETVESLDLMRTTFGLLLAEGRLDDARALAQRLRERDPDYGLPHLLRAVDALADGEGAAAMGQLRQLGEGGLADLLTDLLGAWAAAEAEGAQAADRLEGLAARRGLATLAQLHRALLLDWLEAESAQSAYDGLLEVPADERTLRVVVLVGNYLERSGQAERAETVYAEYREANPDDLLLEPLRQSLQGPDGMPEPAVDSLAAGAAAALFDLAGLLAGERGGQLSMAYANLALELDPELGAARVLIGEILQGRERHADAVAVYRAVEASSPYHWLAGLRIAEELHELERTDEAIDKLESLAEARPERMEPWYRIGNFERTRENWDAAAAAYEEAIARIDEIEQRHWAVIYFRGIAYERSKQWPKAEDDFLKALELQPDQPYVLNYLAYSWVEQKKNLERAEEMLLTAVELRPQDGYIVDSLGWVYYRLGRYEEAVEQLERAVELRPMDPTINDHLGDAYWRTGRKREARVQWQRALSLDPTEDGQEEAIRAKLEEGMPPEGEDL